MNFITFCDKYNITHICKRTLHLHLFNASADEFELSKEMLEIAYNRLSGKRHAILDIHLLGLDEVRVSIVFCCGAWHYGFGVGHKFAVPSKLVKIDEKEMRELVAVEIIAKEMREFVFNYIKRKPYILLKPSVLKAIKIC